MIAEYFNYYFAIILYIIYNKRHRYEIMGFKSFYSNKNYILFNFILHMIFYIVYAQRRNIMVKEGV